MEVDIASDGEGRVEFLVVIEPLLGSYSKIAVEPIPVFGRYPPKI